MMTDAQQGRATGEIDRRAFLAAGAAAGATVLTAQNSLAEGKPNSTAKADVRERARRLHRESVVVVIHDHNPIVPDIPLMLSGGVTCKVYQIGLDVDPTAGFRDTAPIREGWSRRALAELDAVDKIVAAEPKRLVIAKSADDIRRAKREGKVAILLGVEGAKLLDGKVEMVEKYYNRGLRELQLRWGVPNQIVEDQALTPFGRDVVNECNRLRIIIGLTHIPQPAFFQVAEMTKHPPIICHGIATRVSERFTDVTDQQLKALAALRGVIGLHFYSSYLGRKPTVERVVEQVDYITNLVGIDTVALGIDFFPSKGEWAEFQQSQSPKEISWAIPDIAHVHELTEALVARNYSGADVKKVLGENFLRVAKDVFGS